MARTAKYTPSVKKISWKQSSRNFIGLNHGNRTRRERTEATVRFFSSASKGKAYGYELVLEVIYDTDPRNKIRAWLSAASLRLLPEFITAKLIRNGIDLGNDRRFRFPFYRVLLALQGKMLDRITDVHHINGNCLDDRTTNLQPLHKDEHALLHLHSGDVADAVTEQDDGDGIDGTDGITSNKTGFFCYRELHRRQAAQARYYAQSNHRRKLLGLDTVTKSYTSTSNSKLILMIQLHRELRNRLGC